VLARLAVRRAAAGGVGPLQPAGWRGAGVVVRAQELRHRQRGVPELQVLATIGEEARAVELDERSHLRRGLSQGRAHGLARPLL
jgi:hypothetical protein